MSYDTFTPMMVICNVNGQKKISTGETVCMLHIATEFHYDMIQCMYTIYIRTKYNNPWFIELEQGFKK